MVLALENKTIPPNINFTTPNPKSNVLFLGIEEAIN
jgi:acyl transferase domain-containing protein